MQVSFGRQHPSLTVLRVWLRQPPERRVIHDEVCHAVPVARDLDGGVLAQDVKQVGGTVNLALSQVLCVFRTEARGAAASDPVSEVPSFVDLAQPDGLGIVGSGHARQGGWSCLPVARAGRNGSGSFDHT
jgi:hypothetical protein